MAGSVNVLLPMAIVPSAAGLLYAHWKTPPEAIVRLFPISDVAAWLASGSSTPPAATVSGTWMQAAEPPVSVPPS